MFMVRKLSKTLAQLHTSARPSEFQWGFCVLFFSWKPRADCKVYMSM